MHDLAIMAVTVLGRQRLVSTDPILYVSAVTRALDLSDKLAALGILLPGLPVRRGRLPGFVVGV